MSPRMRMQINPRFIAHRSPLLIGNEKLGGGGATRIDEDIGGGINQEESCLKAYQFFMRAFRSFQLIIRMNCQ